MRERGVIMASFAGAVVLGLCYVVYGRLHVDESYYLYASWLAGHSKLPYRDFFFLQNPALPYVYGLPLRILGPSPYVGRLTSLLFSLVALGSCVGLARRLSNEAGAAIAAVLLAFTSFHAYFTTIVRVYAPATALLTLAAWLYLRVRARTAAAAAAGAAIGLAIDFRMTVAPALLALVAVLCLRRAFRAAAAAAASGFAAILLAFLPFLALSFDSLAFQLLGFHSEIRVAGGLRETVAFKLKALPRLANGYTLFFVALLVLIALEWRRHHGLDLRSRWRALTTAEDREADLWVIAIVTFAAHFVPVFVQASYFVLVFPILMALVGAGIARHLPAPLPRPAPALLLALGLLQTLAYGKSSLDVDGRLRGPFMRVRPYVDYLASVTRPDDRVLTSDSQLVPFMARRAILHGYESFEYFPTWPTEKCRRFGVVNDAIIQEQLAAREPAAILINNLSYMKPFPVSIDTGPEARNRILGWIREGYGLGSTFPSPYGPGMTSSVFVRRAIRPPDG